MSFARFVLALRPELLELARQLYTWYKADPARAKAALRRIPSWGTLLDAAETDLDARLEAVRASERKAQS